MREKERRSNHDVFINYVYITKQIYNKYIIYNKVPTVGT